MSPFLLKEKLLTLRIRCFYPMSCKCVWCPCMVLDSLKEFRCLVGNKRPSSRHCQIQMCTRPFLSLTFSTSSLPLLSCHPHPSIHLVKTLESSLVLLFPSYTCVQSARDSCYLSFQNICSILSLLIHVTLTILVWVTVILDWITKKVY